MSGPPSLLRGESQEERIVVDEAETGLRRVLVVSRQRDAAAHAEFRKQLSEHTGVPARDQIILAGPPFKSYTRTLPPKGVAVFLYDRRSLGKSATSGVVETEGAGPMAQLEAAVQPVALPTSPAAMDESFKAAVDKLETSGAQRPPLQATVLDYERQFMLLLLKGQAFQQSAQARLHACEVWHGCIERQMAALSAAVSNLEDHLGNAQKDYAETLDQLRSQHDTGVRLLDGFEQVLDKLGRTPLHPALQGETYRTLRDCVPYDRYRPFVAQCRISQERLTQSTQALVEMYESLERGVSSQAKLRALPPAVSTSDDAAAAAVAAADALDVDIGATVTATPAALEGEDSRALQQLLEQARKTAQQQTVLVAQVENDYLEVRDYVLSQLRDLTALSASSTTDASPHSSGVDVSSGSAGSSAGSQGGAGLERRGSSSRLGTGSQLLQDSVFKLEKKFVEATDKLMPKLDERDAVILATARTLRNGVRSRGAALRKALQDISKLQRAIVDLKTHLRLRTEALGQQQKDFAHIELVHRLPAAYDAFVAEVERRRAYDQLATQRTDATNGQLAAMRDRETGLRERFLQETGPFLPPCFVNTFLPSLFQKPPRLTVEASAVSPELPDLGAAPDRPASSTMGSTLSPAGTAAAATAAADPTATATVEDDARGGSLILTPALDPEEEEGGAEVADLRRKVTELELEAATLRAQVALLSQRGSVGQTTSPHTPPPAVESPHPAPNSTPLPPPLEGRQDADEDLAELEQVVAAIESVLPPLAVGPDQLESKQDDDGRDQRAAADGGGGGGGAVVARRDSGGGDLVTVAETPRLLALRDATSALRRVHERIQDDAVAHLEMISWRRFRLHDVALFLPLPKKGEHRNYLAFHENCPHHYLSQESTEFFKSSSRNSYPEFIVGKIILIDSFTAGPKGNHESNPFGIPEHTEFHILTVESVVLPTTARTPKSPAVASSPSATDVPDRDGDPQASTPV